MLLDLSECPVTIIMIIMMMIIIIIINTRITRVHNFVNPWYEERRELGHARLISQSDGEPAALVAAVRDKVIADRRVEQSVCEISPTG